MRYSWILLFLLCGCSRSNYDLKSYIKDTKELFCIDEIKTEHLLDEPLKSKSIIEILKNISHETQDYLLSYGLIDDQMYENNVTISKEIATQMNQFVYNDLYQKQYFETTFDIGDISLINKDVDLKTLNPGVYRQEDSFYEVLENGRIIDYEIERFNLKSSFSPNLSTSIILPNDAIVESLNSSSIKDYSIDKLKSRFFRFNVKNYQVSGSVSTSGLQLNVSKKTKNDFKIENELTLTDLKCHSDISLENHQFYFRIDYSLKNSLKVSKTKTESLKNKESIILEALKNKLQSLNKSLPIVEDELHLLTFQFEVPSTGKLVTINMDVSLKMFVTGEAEVIIKSSNKQGSQSFQNTVLPLNQQNFEIEPHIEGNVECATVLNCNLKLGNIHIADVAGHVGVGAEAVSSIHYVDKEKQIIESKKSLASYLDLKTELNQYELEKNAYVDLCQDVNVYYFGRIQANQKQSLLRQLGLYGSYTPIKKNISLLHIENHREVEACTKNEVLFNPEIEIEPFDISNYQLFLSKGKTAHLNVSKDTCEFSSTNGNVVEVDENGNIYAKNKGNATIVVKDNNGYERRCLVIVQ